MSFKTSRTLGSTAESLDRWRMGQEDYRIEPHLTARRFANRDFLVRSGYGANAIGRLIATGRDSAFVNRLSRRNAQLNTLRNPPDWFRRRVDVRTGRITHPDLERWREDRGARVITRFIRRSGRGGPPHKRSRI